MSNELKYKRSISFVEEQNKTLILDIALELVIQILKKDETDKCICVPKQNTQEPNKPFTEKELIPNLQVRLSIDNKILFSDVIMKLKGCGYPLTGANIKIFSNEANEYILIGSDPIDENVVLDDFNFNFKLLKIQATCYIEEKYLSKNSANPLSRNNSALDKKSKRTKERKIGYIIEKVNSWRKLYNGFYDEGGKFIKHSLDDAAKKIGISKKSLDDYLLQLRLGRKYGFDFNANRNEKVGKLRAHVKEARQKK
jgi:hypothetical protein